MNAQHICMYLYHCKTCVLLLYRCKNALFSVHYDPAAGTAATAAGKEDGVLRPPGSPPAGVDLFGTYNAWESVFLVFLPAPVAVAAAVDKAACPARLPET